MSNFNHISDDTRNDINSKLAQAKGVLLLMMEASNNTSGVISNSVINGSAWAVLDLLDTASNRLDNVKKG